jgi:hypothetical protein
MKLVLTSPTELEGRIYLAHFVSLKEDVTWKENEIFTLSHQIFVLGDINELKGRHFSDSFRKKL